VTDGRCCQLFLCPASGDQFFVLTLRTTDGISFHFEGEDKMVILIKDLLFKVLDVRDAKNLIY